VRPRDREARQQVEVELDARVAALGDLERRVERVTVVGERGRICAAVLTKNWSDSKRKRPGSVSFEPVWMHSSASCAATSSALV
jgi:hypothetical protein